MIVNDKQGAVDVLTLRVALNAENAGPLLEGIAGAAPGAAPQVVLNLAETPLVDSVGLEALLDARDAVHERGGALKLASPVPLVADVLHATGVGNHFELFDDVRAAVGSFCR